MSRNLRAAVHAWVAASALLALAPTWAQAQCVLPPVVSGLRTPLGITQSGKGNLLVAESGILGVVNSGRISVVSTDGNRRTLLDGLPSATNDANDTSGPAGVLMLGRTLYVVIGIGDSIQVVTPGSPLRSGNPTPASPLFSSVLAVRFSANVEATTGGFVLSPADQQSLADGHIVQLGTGDKKVTVEMVANLPNFTPNPMPTFPENVRGGNPFDVVSIGDRLYLTDGGQNLVYAIDLAAKSFSVLATFPPVPNPLFSPTPPSLGGPMVEAVPTGITKRSGKLLITLFRGFPFPAGTSVVEQVDPVTGTHAPRISGLKTAIDVAPVYGEDDSNGFLVMQHALGPVLGGQGSLTRFRRDHPPEVLTGCLNRPSSLVRDKTSGAIYITELVGGRVSVLE